MGISPNSLSRGRLVRGPNLYGNALDEVRLSLNTTPSNYVPIPNPTIHLFGDESAFSVSMQFIRSPDGIQYMWLPGEPSCEQLCSLLQRTNLKQSVMYVCMLLGRYELQMAESTRNDLYRKLLQSLSGSMKMSTVLVAPIPYPGLEMPAVRAAAFLRSVCSPGHVALLEPTEQFLAGKFARPSLFADHRSLSAEGIRLLAVFLRDRSSMNLPSIKPLV
jgi:hypothetical protein